MNDVDKCFSAFLLVFFSALIFCSFYCGFNVTKIDELNIVYLSSFQFGVSGLVM